MILCVYGHFEFNRSRVGVNLQSLNLELIKLPLFACKIKITMSANIRGTWICNGARDTRN